ncbi:hypothetical protein [Kitasatospora kifunensis]|uniref:Uncharacterized protein n=1 Tax=Kitasatospora kifunensis TaxID=58351 RepID=A0A7W7QZE3_KITKI|nr:hypothetical protein [Kitasatospora kifunensis]MBB4922652.1 hypothetical protein [Kitasatospora kifunensis]
MPFEDDLGHALREAAKASPLPRLELLAAGAAQRGQRRKRRRAVLASAASVAVLAGAGVVALQLRPTVASVSTLAATGPTATAHSAAAQPPAASVGPSPSPSPTAATPVSSSQVLELLKSKLPANLQVSHPVNEERSSGMPGPGVMAGFTLTDGSGKGNVSISITHGKPRPSVAPECGPSVPKCTDTPLPDGSNLQVYLPAPAVAGEQVWSATLQRRDGITLEVESGNVPGMNSGDTELYPNAPLLTGAQLTALAEDPVWLPVMASIPAPS